MRRALVLALVLFVPFASAQSLPDRLAGLTFTEVVFTVAGDTIDLGANRGSLSGNTASDLRHCIDNSNCPDRNLASLSEGNGDGTADADEVRRFQAKAVFALNILGGDVGEFKQTLGELVKVDGTTFGNVQFTSLDLEGAEGTIGSTAPVFASLGVRVEFPNAPKGRTHTVLVERTASDLDLATRVIVRPAKGWSIVQDSVQPVDMRGRWADGELVGTQDQFEGEEPLAFQIKQKSATNPWLVGLGALFLLAVAVAAFVWVRRNRRG